MQRLKLSHKTAPRLYAISAQLFTLIADNMNVKVSELLQILGIEYIRDSSMVVDVGTGDDQRSYRFNLKIVDANFDASEHYREMYKDVLPGSVKDMEDLLTQRVVDTMRLYKYLYETHKDIFLSRLESFVTSETITREEGDEMAKNMVELKFDEAKNTMYLNPNYRRLYVQIVHDLPE